MSPDLQPGTGTRRRTALLNAAMVVVSILISYAACELVFFRVVLPVLPMKFRVYLPDRADFFLQASKSRYLPRDYIALVGDSYAQGMGDWLLSQNGRSSQPFHSADIIHELSGRDVVTLGRAAAGSAEAMVLRITRIFGDAYCYLFPTIEEPKRFFIYFYEGNDIDDNYKLLEHRIRPRDSDVRASIDRFLDETYGAAVRWRCHGEFGDTIWQVIRFHVKFGLNPNLVVKAGPVAPINRIMIDGTATNAQAFNVPSLALNEHQIDLGIVVYERALAWFRRRFPGIPATVVYIPSPATVYRYAGLQVVSEDIYVPIVSDQEIGHMRLVSGRKFPVSSIYEGSHAMCERIRAVSLDQGTGFIDARPALRKEASIRAVHGPRDWNHLNEAGYRVLGKLVAEHLDDRPSDSCSERF